MLLYQHNKLFYLQCTLKWQAEFSGQQFTMILCGDTKIVNLKQPFKNCCLLNVVSLHKWSMTSFFLCLCLMLLLNSWCTKTLDLSAWFDKQQDTSQQIHFALELEVFQDVILCWNTICTHIIQGCKKQVKLDLFLWRMVIKIIMLDHDVFQ